MGRRGDVDDVRDRFQSRPSKQKGIVIAGGGETGFHLAQCLEGRRYRVTLMELHHERCQYIAKSLPHVTVVEADARRKHVLEEERVGSADAFAACIGDDENNIMASVEARDIGADLVMAVVSRPGIATGPRRISSSLNRRPATSNGPQPLPSAEPELSSMYLPATWPKA